MCLSTKNLPAKTWAKIVQKAKKRGYFRVFKVVYDDPYYGQQRTGRCYGVDYAPGVSSTSIPGWHVFLTRHAAKNWIDRPCDEKVVTCYAKTSWLNRLGFQGSTKIKAATFRTLVFPDWERGDMTIREFRAACKEQK